MNKIPYLKSNQWTNVRKKTSSARKNQPTRAAMHFAVGSSEVPPRPEISLALVYSIEAAASAYKNRPQPSIYLLFPGDICISRTADEKSVNNSDLAARYICIRGLLLFFSLFPLRYAKAEQREARYIIRTTINCRRARLKPLSLSLSLIICKSCALHAVSCLAK